MLVKFAITTPITLSNIDKNNAAQQQEMLQVSSANKRVRYQVTWFVRIVQVPVYWLINHSNPADRLVARRGWARQHDDTAPARRTHDGR